MADPHQTILDAIKVAHDSSLEFYKAKGITFEKELDVEYRPWNNKLLPHLIACVTTELEHQDAYTEQFIRQFGALGFKHRFGIELSPKSIEELASKDYLAEESQAPKVDPKETRPADITVYKPFSLLDANMQAFYMAHEQWHLQEQQRGVFSIAPFITEGTATLAAFLSLDARPEFSLSDLTKESDLQYYGVAAILNDLLVNYTDTQMFSKLLDPIWRMEAEKKVLEEYNNHLPRIYENGVYTPEELEGSKAILAALPFYKPLVGNLTQKTFAAAIREKGLVHYADDLLRQDISQYLDFLHERGI